MLLNSSTSIAKADTLVLPDRYILQDPTTIKDNHIGIYLDSTRSMGPEAVIRADSFIDGAYPRAFDPQYVYWFKLIIRNDSTEVRDIILFTNEWDNAFWVWSGGHLEFHKDRVGAIHSKIHDDFYTGQNNDGKLRMSFKPKETKTIYVRIDGVIGKVQFKEKEGQFYLQNKDAFMETASWDLTFVAMGMGIISFLLLTNMILGFIYKTKSSIYYFFFVLCASLFYGGYYKFFWKLNHAINFDQSLMMPVMTICYYLFVSEYLDFRTHYRQAWIVIKWLIMLTSVSVAGMMILFHLSIIDYYHFLPKANTVYVLTSILLIYFFVKTSGTLKYYVLAGMLFWGTCSLLSVITLHSAAYHYSYRYALAGSLGEMTCFLLGLVYKMNRTEMQVEVAKNETLQRKRELLELVITEVKVHEVLSKVYEHIKSAGANNQKLLREVRSILKTNKNWDLFRINFAKAHPGFFEALNRRYQQSSKKQPSELPADDFRLAALLYLGKDATQIAELIKKQKKTVNKNIERLGDKLGLYRVNVLREFLKNIQLKPAADKKTHSVHHEISWYFSAEGEWQDRLNNHPFYFVRLSTIELFISRENKEIILRCLQSYKKDEEINIHGWCIMPCHMYLIIDCNGRSIRQNVDKIKHQTSHDLIRKFRSSQNPIKGEYDSPKGVLKELLPNKKDGDGLLWQEKDELEQLMSIKNLSDKLQYMHHLPIEAGFVDKAEDYPYSSAKDFYLI